MTPLPTLLRERLAFDETTEYNRHVSAMTPSFKPIEVVMEVARQQMVGGSKESTRLAPIHELLIAVVECAVSAEKYLDRIAALPADSRQRDLSEDMWDDACFERDKLYTALNRLREGLK